MKDYNTSSGFSWRHRCVAITSSLVQVASAVSGSGLLKTCRQPVAIMCCFFLSLVTSCSPGKKTEENAEKHMASITTPQGVTIYADKADNRAVMATTDSASNNGISFFTYKIGIIDSVLILQDKKKQQEWGKYFDFDMQKDWVALYGADSIPAVFFQRLPQKYTHKYEAFVVFEALADKAPDTLIYKNSYQSDNTVSQLVLSSKK